VVERNPLIATTKNDDPVDRRHGLTTKLLRYIASALCGFSLVELGAFLTAAGVGGLQKAWQELMDSGQNTPYEAGVHEGQLVFPLVLASVVAMTFGVACGRFLLRTFPPALADQGGRGQAWKVVPHTIVFIGLYIVTSVSFALAFSAKSLTLLGSLMWSAPFVVLWAIASIGLFIYRHRQRRAFLDQPFVLFLRRFSTFSDRAVVALILSQVHYKVPVVFLTPTLSQAEDWDPYIVGFAGLKVMHPWRSAPIVIRARDEAWQDAADGLIRRARLILLDVSETSDALRTEAGMLDKAGRWPDTVCLRLAVPGKTPAAAFSGVRTIDYTKSWLRALPRMAMGLLILVIPAEYSTTGVYLFLPLLGLAPVATLVLFGWYYYSIFGRPAINQKAKVEVRTVLRVTD
jgi:hypothetical protein